MSDANKYREYEQGGDPDIEYDSPNFSSKERKSIIEILKQVRVDIGEIVREDNLIYYSEHPSKAFVDEYLYDLTNTIYQSPSEIKQKTIRFLAAMIISLVRP